MKARFLCILCSVALLLVLAACQAAETPIATITLSATNTLAPTASATLVPPTETPTSTATVTPTPTPEPSSTPEPSPTPDAWAGFDCQPTTAAELYETCMQAPDPSTPEYQSWRQAYDQKMLAEVEETHFVIETGDRMADYRVSGESSLRFYWAEYEGKRLLIVTCVGDEVFHFVTDGFGIYSRSIDNSLDSINGDLVFIRHILNLASFDRPEIPTLWAEGLEQYGLKYAWFYKKL